MLNLIFGHKDFILYERFPSECYENINFKLKKSSAIYLAHNYVHQLRQNNDMKKTELGQES